MESTRLEFEVGALCETETTHERSQKEDKKKIEEGEKEREREREKNMFKFGERSSIQGDMYTNDIKLKRKRMEGEEKSKSG